MSRESGRGQQRRLVGVAGGVVRGVRVQRSGRYSIRLERIR